jgi:hypothetical protein
MIEWNALSERTYGLVVGIERYLGGCRDVDGQVNDALKFAQWLCARGVPKENIHLCVSPLEANRYLLEQSDLEVREATEQSIYYSITDFLSRKEGHLLYIFWAGHGVIAPDNSRRLVCADATKLNLQNQDFDSLLSFLRSEAFKIRHQICIVDACANYSSGGLTDLGGRKFSKGKQRKDSKQFVLFATREGETAKVNFDEKTGYFSQAVRKALSEAPNDRWPPDMETITEKVKQRLTELDKKQLPTYLYYQGWDGDKQIYPFNQVEPPHNIPNSTARKFVGRKQELERLHQLLQDNSVVAITDVTGQGGVGKTELAVQYASDYLAEYSGGCCWLNSQGADLGTLLVEFAIDYLQNFTIPEDYNLHRKVSYCWRNWQPGYVLLVFDDVKDIQIIQPYLPPKNSRFKVLITTRRADLPFAPLRLGGLLPNAALELLAELLGEEEVKQKLELAKLLCDHVDYVPLGIYQIAALRRKPAVRSLC